MNDNFNNNDDNSDNGDNGDNHDNHNNQDNRDSSDNLDNHDINKDDDSSTDYSDSNSNNNSNSNSDNQGDSFSFSEQEPINNNVNEQVGNFNVNPNMYNYPPNFDPNHTGFNYINPTNPNFNNPYMQRSPYIPPTDPRFNNAPNMQHIQYMQYMQQMQYMQPQQQVQRKKQGQKANVDNIHGYENPEIKDETVAIPKSSSSLKTFATIVTILLIVTVCTFAYYFINNDDNYGFSDGNSPSMEIAYTPDAQPNNDPSGVLTNNEIHVKVSPSVVGIAVYTRGLGQVLQSEGSGIVMSEDGFVVTNYHVIANDSISPIVKIEVIMYDGETYEARVIGGDSKTDLAVIKINAPDLVAAEFGDSSKLKIGDRVAVIGNPSGIAFAGSFTQGYVSALSRSIYMSDLNAEIEYIQTDAAINSGNSGGAFINEYGQIVGISAAKMKVEAGYEGMGFAIPINNAKVVVDSLIENGYVAGRPLVGIEYKAISQTLAELNSIPIGLRVYTVNEGVDAEKYIMPGDIITMFDGAEVYNSETVAMALSDKSAGDEMVVTVYRVDEETGVSEYLDFTIILSESVGEKLAETMN